MKRPVELLSALLLAVLALMGRAFFPTEPTLVWIQRGLLGSYATFYLWRTFSPPAPGPQSPLRRVAYVGGLAPLVLFLGFLAGHGLVLLYIFTPTLLSGLAFGVPLEIGRAHV